MSYSKLLSRLIQPLRSRKVRVAVTTVVVAYLAEWGLAVSDSTVYTIIGAGTAVILGIALEDAGEKSGQRSAVSDQPPPK